MDKETFVTQSRYIHGICLEVLRKTTGRALIASFETEICPHIVPDKSVGHFRFTDLLSFYFVLLWPEARTL
jgi:hypothetical protein